jgi:hypothetical protein
MLILQKEAYMSLLGKTKNTLLIVIMGMAAITSALQLACDKNKPNSPANPNDSTVILPKTPYNPYPADGASDIGEHVTLHWNCNNPDSSVLRYKVSIGDDILFPVYSPDTSKSAILPWGKQSLAAKTLAQIYQMQRAYQNQYRQYGLNGVCASWYGQCFRNLLGLEIDTTDRYTYTMCAACLTFQCNATANIDGDRDLDTWSIDQTGRMLHTTKDYEIDFQPGVRYSWQVIAFDTLGDEFFGPIWHFTTSLDSISPFNGPAVPQFPIPVDNSVAVACSTLFQWYCAGEGTGQLTYDLYLGIGNDLIPTCKNIPHCEGYLAWGSHLKLESRLARILWYEQSAQQYRHCYLYDGANGCFGNDTLMRNLLFYIQPNDVYEYNVSATCSTFTCIASANFDSDPMLDIWEVNQTGEITNISDDSHTNLIPGATYSWKVIAHDRNGRSFEGPIWHFTLAN